MIDTVTILRGRFFGGSTVKRTCYIMTAKGERYHGFVDDQMKAVVANGGVDFVPLERVNFVPNSTEVIFQLKEGRTGKPRVARYAVLEKDSGGDLIIQLLRKEAAPSS